MDAVTLPEDQADAPPPDNHRGTSRTQSAGRTVSAVLLVTLTVLLVLFVVFNTQTVRVSLIFGVVDLPLVIALVAAAVLGALIGGLVLLRLRRRKG